MKRAALLIVVLATIAAGAEAQVRINVNGPAHQGVDFPGTWAADPGIGGACGPKESSDRSMSVSGTVDDVLFQGEVWEAVTCRVDLAPGDYRVSLYFAEIWWGTACSGTGGIGTRVFDILLEGVRVYESLDTIAEAGGCAADPNSVPVVKSFDVTISDGALDVQLVALADWPSISALEVVPLDSDVTFPPDPNGVYAIRFRAPSESDQAKVCMKRVGVAPILELGCVDAGPNVVSSITVGVAATPGDRAEIRGFAYDQVGNESLPSLNAVVIDFDQPPIDTDPPSPPTILK